MEVLSPFDFYIDPAIVKSADAKAERPKLKLPKELYKYQKKGVEFIYATQGRTIVADEMGLGKSAESLVFADQFGGKTLIVAPSSVVLKWAQKECPMWAKDKVVEVISTGATPLNPQADITIMSYGIMVSKFEELNLTPFTCIIFDESHYLKSSKARRTRVAKAMVKAGVPHVLFLSGTPFMNRPAELFPLLNMLDPKGFSNYFQFAIRYCGGVMQDGHWLIPPDGASNLEELAQRLSHIMLRRTKRDVALELPDLTRSFLPVHIENMGDYKEAKRDMQSWLKSQGSSVVNPQHVLTRLNVLRQIIGRGKAVAAVELAEDILESDNKVVLFAHHKEVVNDLVKGLSKYGVGIISGDTPAKDRQGIVNEFLNETLISQKQKRVMIITIAGSEGIDLYSASNIIFCEREFTPAREEQAEARLHRIGQKNPVTAHYLIATNTMDEKMNEIVEKKRKMFGQVIRQDEILTEIMESFNA